MVHQVGGLSGGDCDSDSSKADLKCPLTLRLSPSGVGACGDHSLIMIILAVLNVPRGVLML